MQSEEALGDLLRLHVAANLPYLNVDYASQHLDFDGFLCPSYDLQDQHSDSTSSLPVSTTAVAPASTFAVSTTAVAPASTFAVSRHGNLGAASRKTAHLLRNIVSNTTTCNDTARSRPAEAPESVSLAAAVTTPSAACMCWAVDCIDMDQHKEMVYRAAAMQPIQLLSSDGHVPDIMGADVDNSKPRRNMQVSKDPQSIAARQRRQRISEKMQVLQRLVPGGMKMDTASMLEEAAHYLRFLKAEVERMEAMEEWMSVTAIAGARPCYVHYVFKPEPPDDAAMCNQSPPTISSHSSNGSDPVFHYCISNNNE